MPRYDRHYDYGLRGYREATAPRNRGTFRSTAYDRPTGAAYDRPYGLTNRVTARYNAEYVFGDRGDRYPRNYTPFGGDREQRIGDLRYYRQPYTTIGGTHTFRGAPMPMGYGDDYDYADYDRDFRRGR